jgi:hypothetical protein
MSSASSLPYHLRQNKAIDRNLFVDLLGRIGRYRNISDYRYVGFGGPFLEDHKVLHASLRLRNMTSLEKNPEVVKRQEFNRPHSSLTLQEKTSGEFLNDFDFDEPSVVWFDYTVPKELGIQLAEIELLVRKLSAGDVFKVTLNAAPESLGTPSDGTDLREFRLERLLRRANDYSPMGAEIDDVTTKNYPGLLLRCVESAAKKGLETKPRCIVLPLSAFSYADGQQMLTVTAIIIDKIDRVKFYTETRLEYWPFSCKSWADLRSISVPQLSSKERMHVEALLPDTSDAKTIFAELGYYVGMNEEEGAKLMTNFIEYYRMYPWYSKVVL